MTEQKVFIIGLPRTATTSVCVATLSLGFKTAHTAYTQRAMDEAQIIADTPIFCDYQQLDKVYPNAKFVYLTRESDKWLPSIRQLLARMFTNLQRSDGGFNPILKRCYNEVFEPLTLDNIAKDSFLLECYQRHYQGALDYFNGREQDLLIIDVADAGNFQRLANFLSITDIAPSQNFEHINIGGKVTAWKKIKHPLKIEATEKGKIDSIKR
ncbi:sulfotransferase family protein [Shewanella psychropiezotolerans]|uniref:Sulfotransferase family protein n=1 Tax=Shewanella psychropiezotolerans TaxID=2593655 RepID=A0ABX5X101_9GAMM|nr:MULTISPECIES: sulfotransferase family protein [Shewanella]MPY21334.1 sulfotransferase family protein [Shewanella sp. YLB-07]MPY22121.1 sulfotransferase family protein [Shewanella sp. YLB-07]QDO85025.1 sulfotransferase family protein [Shewanella psychropiezotolerans]